MERERENEKRKKKVVVILFQSSQDCFFQLQIKRKGCFVVSKTTGAKRGRR